MCTRAQAEPGKCRGHVLFVINPGLLYSAKQEPEAPSDRRRAYGLHSHLALCENIHPTEERGSTKPLKNQIEKNQGSVQWGDTKASNKRTQRGNKEMVFETQPWGACSDAMQMVCGPNR